jgi:hypothetical protein
MIKSTVVIFNQFNIKNNKIDKKIFEKNYNKKNHVGKHFSNQRCFKEKNYKAKFLTSSV